MIESLRLIKFLLRTSQSIRLSRLLVWLAVITGLASGVGYTALVAVINSALANRERSYLIWFVVLCIVVPASRLGSQAMFNAIGARTILELRMTLSRRILAARLDHLERIGPGRLLASLTDDVTSITNALVQLPVIAMHLAITLTCIAYMGWLSWRTLLFVLVVMALGMVSYLLPMNRSRALQARLREHLDALFSRFHGLIHGSKELRLSRQRRRWLLDEQLEPTGEQIRHLTFTANTLFTAVTVWGNLLFFIVIGLLLFVPGWVTDAEVLSGYVLTLIYLKTPLEVIFLTLPNLAKAMAAAAKLDRLGLDLLEKDQPPMAAARAAALPVAWRRLEIDGVEHRYAGEEGKGFQLGPIRLSFEAGEIVFLIGGNGSGKTTLAKLITGLYAPDSGQIRLDGVLIDDERRDAYRQLFSAVFFDFFLFERVFAEGSGSVDDRARRLLVELELPERVRIEDGRLSTLDLSQGQRKRLALLGAYLEDRPIYFFDEWAADQDPHFRSLFYRQLLPELKRRGKSVFVISHDDHFYDVADRLIKLGEGQVEWDRRPSSEPVPAVGGLAPASAP